ncbi:hypothetical protein V8D89_002251 [Ganoderma adspersum]
MMVGFDLLNDDVVTYLLGFILQAADRSLDGRAALVPLSSTCKWLRNLSKPFIFRMVHFTVGIAPPTPDFYLPSSLWTYVQQLTIADGCLDQTRGRDQLNSPNIHYRTPSYVPHLYVCQAFIGPVIQYILRQMSSLTKLSLRTHMGVVHGPYWTFLRFALSLPRLRDFEMTGLTFCPVILPDETLELEDGSLAPLTAFRYEAILTRDRTFALSVEKDALSLVLAKIHRSLTTLALPSEPAPIALMSSVDWPNLRELKLRGMRWPQPSTPLVLLFANMPRLRSLVLELRIPDEGDPEAVWPRGLPPGMTFPWPKLEELTVANPHPADGLFAHLPPSLRKLALPSCPRKCVEEWLWLCEDLYPLLPHAFYLLKASDLLGVLERSPISRLEHLEIEYDADEKETDLLRYLAIAFPGLSSLTLYRYRRSEETVVRVEELVQPLAPLESLRALSIHPDLETRPERVLVGLMRGREEVYETEALERFTEILEGAALRIARTLNESLEQVSLWMPSNGDGPVSANFSVIRAGPEKDGGLRIQWEAFTHHDREDVWGL